MTQLQLLSLVGRNLVPISGVLILGWSAPNILILYSVDTSLALATVGMLVGVYGKDHGKDTPPILLKGPLGWLGAIAGIVFLAAIFAVAFSIPMYVILAPFGWSLTGSLADPAFVHGLETQAAFSLLAFIEGYRSLSAQKNVDSLLQRRTGFIMGRWIITMAISVTALSFIVDWLPVESAAKVVGFIVLLVYVAVTLFFELFPERALSLIGPGSNATKEKSTSDHGGKSGRKKRGDSAQHKIPSGNVAISGGKKTYAGVQTYSRFSSTILIPSWLSITAGLFLILIGTASLWQELSLNRSGFRTSGHVLDYVIREGGGTVVTANLQLDGPSLSIADTATPMHLKNAFSWHPWAEGLRLDLMCRHDDAGAVHCRIADWQDRWLPPAAELAFGLGLLLWGLGKRAR